MGYFTKPWYMVDGGRGAGLLLYPITHIESCIKRFLYMHIAYPLVCWKKNIFCVARPEKCLKVYPIKDQSLHFWGTKIKKEFNDIQKLLQLGFAPDFLR